MAALNLKEKCCAGYLFKHPGRGAFRALKVSIAKGALRPRSMFSTQRRYFVCDGKELNWRKEKEDTTVVNSIAVDSIMRVVAKEVSSKPVPPVRLRSVV